MMKREFLWAVGLLFCIAPPALTKEGFVEVASGVKLHYLEEGSADQAIVFVPGWTMTAEIWRDQLQRFSPTHRAVAVSLRAHGKSTTTSEKNTIAQFARDLDDFLAKQQIEKATLVGWSMGVMVTLEYVKRFGSDRLEAIVLVDGSPAGRNTDDWKFGFPDEFFDFIPALSENRESMTAAMVRQMFKRPHPDALYAQITENALRTPTDTAIALILQMRAQDYRPVLPQINLPALVVVTGQLSELGEWMKGKLPHGRLEVFAEAGHVLFVDEPERFHKVVLDFLGRH